MPYNYAAHHRTQPPPVAEFPYWPAQPHSFHCAEQPWQQTYQFGVPLWEEPTLHSQPPVPHTLPWQQPPDPPDWHRAEQPPVDHYEQPSNTYGWNHDQTARNPSLSWDPPPLIQPPQPVQPRRATCWDPPGSRNQSGLSPYEQPPCSFEPAPTHGPEPYYTLPGQQDRVWSYRLDRPSLPPLPIIKPSSCWGPPGQHNHIGPPQFNLHQSSPLPPRSPTCWDPPGQQASQGYPTYDQSPPPDWPTTPPQCSPSSWCSPKRELPTTVDVDGGYTKHPFGEETWVMAYEIDDPFCRTETATVHASAAVPHAAIPPPPAAVFLSCSPREQIGEGDALLEYGKDDGFLKASLLSPLSRHEALECIQIGPDLCQQISDDAVKAIAICCPQRRQLEISGVQDVEVGAMNALTTHCQNSLGFSKEDNQDYRELLSVQDSFRYTEGVVTEGVKVADFSEDAPAVADEKKIASRNQVEEKECEGKQMKLEYEKILEKKRMALQATKIDIRKDNSGGAAAHIYFFEFISKVDLGMTYPIYRGNSVKYCHSNCRQGFQMRIALPKFLLDSVDGVNGRILKEQTWLWKQHLAPVEMELLIRAQLTRETDSLAPDQQCAYKQALYDRSAQEHTAFLSEVAELSHSRAVDVAKMMEPIPSQTVVVSCAAAAAEEGEVVMAKAWVTLTRKNGLYGTLPDATRYSFHSEESFWLLLADPKSNSWWFSHNISFTDEATTVSGTSISSLVYPILNLLCRIVTISLTNVVILGVVKRLMSCLNVKIEHTKYAFGDVILLGRGQRMKINEHKGFCDVFLDSRVSEPGCIIARWFPP